MNSKPRCRHHEENVENQVNPEILSMGPLPLVVLMPMLPISTSLSGVFIPRSYWVFHFFSFRSITSVTGDRWRYVRIERTCLR